jgi:hypothetical protein
MHPSSSKSFKMDWKSGKYEARTRWGFRAIFPKKQWRKLSFILFLILCFSHYFCFWHSKNIYRPTMTQKSLNLVAFNIQRTFIDLQWHKNCSIWLIDEKIIGKCSMIRSCLVRDDFTHTHLSLIKWLNEHLQIGMLSLLCSLNVPLILTKLTQVAQLCIYVMHLCQVKLFTCKVPPLEQSFTHFIFLVEVGLRPQNAIWIFRVPRGIVRLVQVGQEWWALQCIFQS